MSDTPIAERLAAELGSPRPLHWRITGWITQDFEPGALGSEIRSGGPEGCGPAPTGPHHPPLTEGPPMSKPSPEEVQQMRDAAEQLKNEGADTRGIEAVIDLVTGVDGPQ